MSKEKEILIELKVEGSDALKATVQLTDKLNELKEAKRQLEKQMKEDKGNAALKEQYAILSAEIDATSKQLRTYKGELSNIIKANNENEGSLKQLQSTLRILLSQWDKLSQTERESAKGMELKEKIDATHKQVLALEESTGRFYKNVGHYEKALEGANVALQGLGVGASGAIGSIQKLGAAFKALLDNPWGALIAAIVVALQQLRKAFKENDDAGTNLARAFSMFQPIIDAVKNAFSFLADVLGKVALGISKVYKFVYGMLIPGYKDAAKAADELVVAQDRLQDKQREATVENAKNNQKIAENNAKLADKTKYDAKERIKMLNENAKLERQNMERTKANAAEEYRIALEQSKRKRKLSDEDKDRLADLEAAMIQAETDYQNSLVSINKKTTQAIKEIENEKIQAEKEAAEKRKAAAEKYKQQQEEILQLRRSIEDNMVASMNDGVEKQRKELEVQYKRQIEDYKKAMKEKPYLADYYNKLILQADAKFANDDVQLIANAEKAKAKIREDISKGINDMAFNNAMAQLNLMADSFDKREQQRQLQLRKSLADSAEAERKALEDFKGTEEQRLALTRQYNEQRDLMNKAYISEREKDLNNVTEQISKQFEESITNLIGSATVDAVTAQTDALIAEQDRLLQAQQISLKQYNDNVARIHQTAQNAIKDINLKMANSILQSMQNAVGGIQALMNEVAGDNERMQGFMKALALAQIAVSTAVSIGNAIQGATAAGAATGPGAPIATPLFIAELVGIVTSALASSIAVLKKTETPNAPRFATGGLITHGTTGTADDVPIMASKGEYVVRKKSVDLWGLDFMNFINGMSARSLNGRYANGGEVQTVINQQNTEFTMEMMKEMLSEIQPVVSVREITNIQSRVKTKENIARY